MAMLVYQRVPQLLIELLTLVNFNMCFLLKKIVKKSIFLGGGMEFIYTQKMFEFQLWDGLYHTPYAMF